MKSNVRPCSSAVRKIMQVPASGIIKRGIKRPGYRFNGLKEQDTIPTQMSLKWRDLALFLTIILIID